MATLRELLTEGAAALTPSSHSPRLDAELLLGSVIGKGRAYLIGFGEREAGKDAASAFRALIERRRKHEPVAYLVGKKEFFGLDLEVSPAVLVPRPETELIVERAIEYIEQRKGPVRVLDLGTGSGCIPIAIASFVLRAGKPVHIVAVDQSPEALSVARKNAERHGLSGLIEFLESNWFSALASAAPFELIVSNPPYIPEGSSDRGPETDYEPHQALFGGADGLSQIRLIFRELPKYLAPGGIFLCEIGAPQAEAVKQLWLQLHPDLPARLEILPDLSGRDRVFFLQAT